MILQKNIRRFGLLLCTVLFSAIFRVSGTPAEQIPEAELDVKEMVFEHLGDDYTWHILQTKNREIAIYLPVIVKGPDGWNVFSSHKLGNKAVYNGFYIAHEGQKYAGKIVYLDNTGSEVRPLDLSITKNVLGLMINCCVLLLVILPLAGWYRKRSMEPAKGFRGAVEMLMMSIRNDVIKPCVGEDYERFAPYLLTVFFFIFVNNLMGLVPFFPGGANITGNIAITFVLALGTFLTVNFSGTRHYWKEILWPDVPVWLKVPAPIMPVIELFGVFTKPFALMIRLFANIMAGHAVILGLVSLIFITASMGVAVNAGMTALSVVFTIFMNLVELLVAFIQAYVFTLLSSVFIGMARVKHENI